jgi:class 3 adenylate cyclase
MVEMASEPKTRSQVECATALFEHLKDHPTDVNRPAPELAEQFGLSASFVHEVITNTNSMASWELDRPLTPRRKFDLHKKVGKFVSSGFLRAIGNPVLFVTVTTIIGGGAVAIADAVIPNRTFIFGAVPLQAVLASSIIILTLVSHLASFFISRRIRSALQASLVIWVLIAILIAIGMILSNPTDSVSERATGAVFGILAALFIVSGYAIAGVIAAILGGWARAKSIEKQEASMSRQEMLERYFELRSRLERGGTRQRVTTFLKDSKLARFFRRSPAVIASAIFAASSLLADLADNALGTRGLVDNSGATASFSISSVVGLTIALLLLAVRAVTYVGVGLFSRTIVAALGASLLASAVDYAIDFVVQWHPSETLRSPTFVIVAVLPALVGMIISGFAAIAVEVQRRNVRQASLDENDSATVLAEMLRIQWRLADRANSTCILVIDAAKSSQMKANADPLIVEYSFRQYQEWIAETIKSFEGKVHFTAGDGAVVAFPTCENAFRAARRLQSVIADFNRSRNRLELPFRVRIGLHVGRVAGAVDDVQFTEVIDIAAHIEAVATVGGIAVSEAVALSLPEFEFIPIAQVVDGQRVFLARSPTEEG